MKRVLFLCSGNYYRSRFAEILFNWHAERQGSEWRAESRGLALDPRNAGPLSSHIVQHLEKRGITSATADRLPIAAGDDDFAQARVIIAVKQSEHRPLIESQFAKWAPRVEYWNVHDLDCAPPHVAIPQLEALVAGLLEQLEKNPSWSAA
jgi:protein-tyrosine phosphatase